MNRHSIYTIIIVAIFAFIVGYAIAPHIAKAPSSTDVLSNAPDNSTTIPLSIVSLREDASSSPTVIIEYPQFPSLSKDFNEDIATSVTSRLADFRKEAAQTEAARDATANNIPGQPDASIPPSAYSFIASWQEAQINSQYVSFIIRFDSYAGGANGNQEIQTFNYDISEHKIMTLADLFPGKTDYLTSIASTIRSQLAQTMSNNSNGNAPTDMLDAGTEPTIDNFKDFTFDHYTATFYFPKYAVAPGSFGEQHADILMSSIE